MPASPNATLFQPDASFELTWQQATVAFECLENAVNKEKTPDELLAYLIHAAVLFFVARDQQAFAAVYAAPSYKDIIAGKPIRQLPTHQQLQAVLKSLNAPGTLIAMGDGFSDQALGVSDFKVFRDQIVQHGVPVLAPARQSGLVDEALHGWKALCQKRFA